MFIADVVAAPVGGTITIADATAGGDIGVWSLLTSSTEKTCKPGEIFGHV